MEVGLNWETLNAVTLATTAVSLGVVGGAWVQRRIRHRAERHLVERRAELVHDAYAQGSSVEEAMDAMGFDDPAIAARAREMLIRSGTAEPEDFYDD